MTRLFVEQPRALPGSAKYSLTRLTRIATLNISFYVVLDVAQACSRGNLSCFDV